MNITKIRHGAEGKTEVRWTVMNGDDREERVLVSKDPPAETFRGALKALGKDFAHALDLMDARSSLRLTTVTIGSARQGTRSFILHGVKEVNAGACPIATPMLHEPTDELSSGPSILQPDQLKRLDKLIDEAGKYIEGNRTGFQIEMDETVS